MSKVIVLNHLTLDGVMQAPGRPDEDRRGGFAHGGWAKSRGDAIMGDLPSERMANVGALLLGRRTYEDFYAFWPHQPEPNPFASMLGATQKYVASTTLQEPLPWSNSTLLSGDAADAVARLKEQLGKDLLILGSGALIQALMQRSLVDEFILMIHPLVLGTGRRLFPDEGPFATLRLVDAKSTAPGVLIAIYQVAAAAADATPSALS
ncbi:MAG: deaminase [Chloroflexi bacterium]|nr:deaminase [Chloroflexota bacterium]